MTRGQSKFNFVYVFAVLFLCAQSRRIPTQDVCRNSDGRVGNCVKLNDCGPMVNFLDRAPRPMDQKTIEVLRKYQCGYEGWDPKMCCPNGPIPYNVGIRH